MPEGFEQLGVFYLGRLHDLATGRTGDAPLLYDSRDLVTHAVCMGMTGSGKTGLCIDLIEEAALDGIPTLAIDPKGDLGNLLLTFPDLAGADFRPWVDEEEAARQKVTPEAFAASEAERWRTGLEQWGQSGERIGRLREAAEFTMLTPGSTAGTPISILRSFAAPPAAVRDDPELLADRIGTAATSLLGLVGVDADPIQSREHVLLATILQTAWTRGEDLDLAGLIGRVQQPDFRRIGVLDLEAFYPSKQRFELALRLNGLLAAPGFSAWIEGEPLDVDRLLWNGAGKPRVTVVSIAHLGDAERTFFVALLLNEVVGWMRGQQGTASLRAILYMDEIFGFFPPVANPPTKKPLLTLLKQARAFGLGVVLATQNPVDLDYKGLSNAGTWFLGRLQTERDKARVLEGLEGIAAGGRTTFDRAALDATLAGLGKRIFLMNDVHESEPAVFETRWAMSYLRGPLTRAEIQRLSDLAESRPPELPAEPPPIRAPAAPGSPAPARGEEAVAGKPVFSPEVPETFIPPSTPIDGPPRYRPVLLGHVTVHFDDRKSGIDATRSLLLSVPFAAGPVPVAWDATAILPIEPSDLTASPLPGARFETPPAPAAEPRSYARWGRELADWVYRNQTLEILRSPALGEASRPGESERDFRIRLRQAAREKRDAEVEALRRKHAPRLVSLTERIRKAEERVGREGEQARQDKLQTAISVGATVLGSMLGRRGSTLGRATTAARGVGRLMRSADDVERAQASLAAARERLAALETEFRSGADAIAARYDAETAALETVTLRPRRKDITTGLVALGWSPISP